SDIAFLLKRLAQVVQGLGGQAHVALLKGAFAGFAETMNRALDVTRLKLNDALIVLKLGSLGIERLRGAEFFLSLFDLSVLQGFEAIFVFQIGLERRGLSRLHAAKAREHGSDEKRDRGRGRGRRVFLGLLAPADSADWKRDFEESQQHGDRQRILE